MKYSDIDVRKAVRTPHTYDPLKRYVEYGKELTQCKNKEEVKDLLKRTRTWKRVDTRAFEMTDDLTLLKERLMFYWIAENIHKYYTKEASRPGPRGDRLRRMFESINETPVHYLDVADKFNISRNILKQHRRYDTCPDRGITQIQKGMITRKKPQASKRNRNEKD